MWRAPCDVKKGVCLLFGMSGLLLITAVRAQQAGKPQSPPRAETTRTAARMVDAEGKMSWVAPAGWARSKQIPPPTIVYVAPSAPPRSVNLGIVSEPVGDKTMEQFVKANRDFAAQTPGLTVYAEGPATLDGVRAVTWRIHVRPPGGGTPRETRQIFCVRNRRSYVITLAALSTNIKRYDPVFDKVVASFRWEK